MPPRASQDAFVNVGFPHEDVAGAAFWLSAGQTSHLGAVSQCQGILDGDTQVANRALYGVPRQYLNGPHVPRLLVYEGSLVRRSGCRPVVFAIPQTHSSTSLAYCRVLKWSLR